MDPALAQFQIQSTAGAIPVVNEKGEVSMQKVKVHRYVSGKRPEYAPVSSSEAESEDELPFERPPRPASPELIGDISSNVKNDPRLRRLQQRHGEDEERITRHRHILEPEVLGTPGDEEVDEHRRWREEDESSEEEEVDEELMEQRRQLLRAKLRKQTEEVELMDVEDEGQEVSEESEESEYEEYTDSEEETGPRLKPVFVRKRDRVTIQEREHAEQHEKELEVEQKKNLEERRKNTLKMVEDDARREQAALRGKTVDPSDAIITDDENDEVEYETWKVREMRRIKRDREEKEAVEKERQEVEKLRNMTEEERRAELRANPRAVTNKSVKGKYKFLQKYYHRGAFFMDEEKNVLCRDVSQPTLEDHFDKTILPKVMQVKNFGRSGRTKYTHLVDQDTTQFDSPWVQETAINLKFTSHQAGGMKPVFERPSVSKKRK